MSVIKFLGCAFLFFIVLIVPIPVAFWIKLVGWLILCYWLCK